MRHADEDRERLYDFLLQRNSRMYGVAFALDRDGDVYLVGRLPLAAVTPDELDRLLGAVLTYADENFDAMLRIGFGASIRREWAWRVKRGESLANLRPSPASPTRTRSAEDRLRHRADLGGAAARGQPRRCQQGVHAGAAGGAGGGRLRRCPDVRAERQRRRRLDAVLGRRVGAAVREVVAERFGVDTPVVVRTGRQLAGVLAWNPFPEAADEPAAPGLRSAPRRASRRRRRSASCSPPTSPRTQLAARGGEVVVAYARSSQRSPAERRAEAARRGGHRPQLADPHRPRRPHRPALGLRP